MNGHQTYIRRNWEDVAEGQELGRTEMELPLRKLIINAASTRDFFPAHHDPEYARSQNQKTAYISTMFYQGFIDRIVTDWTGPEAMIRRRKISMQGSIYAGDTMYGEGRVSRAWIDDAGRYLADLDIVIGNQDGPVCPAQVTVQLLARE